MSDNYKKAIELLDQIVASGRVRNSSGGTSGAGSAGTSNSSGTTVTAKESSEDYFTRRKRELGLDANVVDENYITQFLADANAYTGSDAADRARMGFGAGLDVYDARKQTGQDLSSRSYAIRNYLKNNKDNLSEEYYTQLTDYLDTFDQWNAGSLHDYYSSHNIYSQYENEEEYAAARWNQQLTNKYQGKSYVELQEIMGELHPWDDHAELEWLKQYAPTVMTDTDYGVKIGEINTQIYPLERSLEEMTARRDELQRLNTGYARSSTISQEQKEAVAEELEQLNAEIARVEAQLEALNASRWELTNDRKYNTLDDRPDFETGSAVAAEGATAGFGIGIGTSWFGKGDPVYDYINDLDGTRQEHLNNAARKNGESPYSIYDLMSNEEIANYNYLYNTEGKESAQEYLGYLEYALNERRMGTIQENAQAFANDAGVLASLASVSMNLMSGIGALDVAGQNIVKGWKENITGEYAGPIDYNRAAMAPAVTSSAIRETRTQHYKDKYGEIALDPQAHPILSRVFNGKSVGDVYQLGMSMVDSATVAALSPVLGSYGTALLGGSASSRAILDAVENGATDEQALTMGILSGTFELLFEKYELEHLLGADSNMLKALVNQALTEGIGEGATTIANSVADFMIMAENSGYQRLVAEYMQNGLSQNEAAKQALLDYALQVGWDVVGGMFSGAMMGAVTSPITNAASRNAEAQRIYGSDPGALVTEALEIDPQNTFAQRMQGRLNDGKGLNGSQLNRLVQQNEQAIAKQDMQAIQDAAAQRLTELGETSNVESVAVALARQAAGEKLSKADRQAITQSRYGQRVSNELNTENIRSGDYASAWVQNIGTERINAKDYNKELMDLAIETAGATASRTNPAAPGQEIKTSEGNLPGGEKGASYEVSEDGKAHLISDPDEPVEIRGFASLENGQAVLKLADGSNVVADDVSFGSDDQALVYSTVADMGVSLETANELVKAYDPGKGISAQLYALDIQEAFDFGGYNYSLKLSENDPYASVKKQAWNDGRIAAIKSSKVSQNTVEHTYQEAQKALKQDGKTVRGEYHATLEEGVSATALNESQRASYQMADQVAQAAKVNIRVYAGKTGEWGYYNPNTDEIHLNLNATNKSGKAMMAFTLGHELVHRAKKGSPAKYQAFADFLMEQYGKKGVPLEEMIGEQLQAAKDNGITITREQAFEEVVSEACQRMLLDTDAGKRLAEFGAQSQQNRSLLEDIKRWITAFMEKLRSIFQDVDPDSMPGREFARFDEGVKQILADMFVEMTIDAGEHLSTIQAASGKNTEVNEMEGASFKLSVSNNPYSYDALISKPDMVVTTVGGNVPKNRADVAHVAKQNAAKVGKFDPKTGSVSVHVEDIDADVILSTKGLRHGLRRTNDPLNVPNYIVTVKAGEILKNSIRINEITPSDDNAKSSYVLMGAARDANGTYIVRFVVNHFDNNITAMDVLYAINAKKEPAATKSPRLTAEPLSVTSSTISIEELLDLVNQYFPDILPEEVLKHYGHDSRPEGDLGEDALYKLPVGEDTSPRALLANAFEGVVQNDIERRNLQQYQENVDMLNAEEAKLEELRAEIYALSFAKGKRDAQRIRDLKFDAMQTENRINTLDKMLLRFEASAPLQNILKREKEMVRKRERERVKAAAETYRKKGIETMEKREARLKLQKLVLDTAKWISYPSKTDVKCPDILKKPYGDFLNGIDLSSKRLASGGDPTKNDLRLANAMDSLATALERITMAQDPNQDAGTPMDSGYLDLPAGFVQKLRDMTENIKALMVDGDYVVNNMTAAEVRQLSQLIRTLNHAIREMSTLYANLRFANIEALGDDSMGFMDNLGEIAKTGGLRDFVEWQNALPYYAFKRFGDGGESIFEGLMDAQDKLAFLAQQIFDFRDKTWTDKEAKAWSEDTHTISLPSGRSLTLTTSDAMSIYCLSRRKQGLQHLLGGGARVIGLQKGSRKAKDSRSVLSIQDIEAINSSLTDRQRKVAGAMQEFMSTVCSEWGNEISMKRFLTREFTEKHYFPIESNDENLPTKDPSAQQSDLFRLLNISATKPIDPRANNEVIVRNIFDVFTGHASDMARLNAYGLPLLDYMKWLNYREKTANEEGQIQVRGVRKSMETAYGNAAKSYVLNLVKDVNGRPSDGGLPSFYTRMLKNAKTAMVGSSLRVATLQITSYPRAALVLNPRNMALGLTKKPNIDKAKKYCGIALWKSFGFYDTNISRSIEDQMKGVTDVRQKMIELSLKGAEIGDALTWGVLWNACEYEVASTNEYQVGSEEFNNAVGKKLREVVYATQVVDSTLTRSEMMRSKNAKAQEVSSFMSEPTLSANILMDAGFRFNLENRRSGNAKAAWKKTGGYVAKAVAVYSIGQIAAALLEGLWDAWRDDEDEKFGEKFIDAFVENLVLDLLPFNKIPIISDMAEAVLSLFDLGFFSAESLYSTGLTQMVSAVDAWRDVLGGKSSATAYNALYKTVRAISSFYGVAFGGVMREVVALWNNTAGTYDSTRKIRTYELSDVEAAGLLLDAIAEGNNRQEESLRARFNSKKDLESAMRSAIRERYFSGEITAGDVLTQLVEYGGLKGDEAFWQLMEWDHKIQYNEDFKKYADFFNAVETGKDLEGVIQYYTDNGVEAKTLRSQITDHFKPLYVEMSESERAALRGKIIDAMVALGSFKKDAEDAMDEWDFEAKHGESYEDMVEAFKAGDMSRSEMKKILLERGMDEEEAEAKLNDLEFVIRHGIEYEDREKAFIEGQITEADLRRMYQDKGKEEDEINNLIEAHKWLKAHPGYELYASTVVSYIKPLEGLEYSIEDTGMDIDTFLRERAAVKEFKGDVDEDGKTVPYSKINKAFPYIDSLNLTPDQKTALAVACGWELKTVLKNKLW